MSARVPDFPQTRLALRAWQLDRASMAVRSLNAPGRKVNWIARAMAAPAGAWPHEGTLAATCRAPKPGKPREGEEPAPPHGPLPGKDCTCGIYATTDLDVISGYLSREAPVLGIVEMGGRVIPATQGYRAAVARVAVILLIDEALTEPHRVLRDLAAAYRIPAVIPHSACAEDYREIAALSTVAGEAEEFLRQAGGGKP